MNAKADDVVENLPLEATEAELMDAWASKRQPFTLPNGHIVHIRPLTLDERARCEKLESPTGSDALAMAIAMGCIKSNGEPMFGPFAQAIEKIRKLNPEPMIEVGKQILRISGMATDSAEQASGN